MEWGPVQNDIREEVQHFRHEKLNRRVAPSEKVAFLNSKVKDGFGSGDIFINRPAAHSGALSSVDSPPLRAEMPENISQLFGDSDALFRLFTNCVLDYALFALDPDGNVSTWNRGAERIFGYSASEIVGCPVTRFYPPDLLSRNLPAEELDQARINSIFEGEGWRIRKDGGLIRTYVVMNAISGGEGKFAGYGVVTRDITEQWRSIQAGHEQKRRLRSILETAVDAIIIIDEQGIIESFNPAGERLFGYSADEVVGRNVNMLMPQPYAAEHNSYIQRYLRTGEAKIIGVGRQVQAKRKDGSFFAADLAVSEFYDGKPLFTGIIRDITERKNLEAEVLQIADAEQRRIGQELHDDAQQQLTAFAMIARNAADSLAAVQPQTTELQNIHTKLERIVKGIRGVNQSLRELARGLIPLQLDAHGLSDSLSLLASQVREIHEIDCECLVDKVVQVHDKTIATHLYRIAQEAVNNAIKHAFPKRIMIRLRKTDRSIQLEITDHGKGIDDTAKPAGRGMHIMRYRASLIGAMLNVQRNLEGGTTVTCILSDPGGGIRTETRA